MKNGFRKRILNILYITYTLEPGGAERMIFSLTSKINREKYKPVVCSLRRGGDLVEELKKHEIKVFILKKKKGLDFSVITGLKRIIAQEKIDIIHSHNFPANFWGRITGKLRKVPILIATEHSLSTNRNWLQKKADHILSMFTDCIIAVSESVRQSHISAERILPQKITTIYNGIELDQFNTIKPPRQMRKELKLNDSYSIVGIVGRLTAPKGHQFYLEAAQIVAEVIPNTKFILIGDGVLKEKLIEYSMRSGLEKKVMFLGFRKDRLDIINIFNVAVLSSVREGHPLALLEYMGLKKPIVVTDVGGIPEVIINGVNGFIVPPAKPHILAEKIIEVLQNKKLAKRMGQEAYYSLREKFTEEIMVRQTEALYDRITRTKLLS